MRAYKTLTLCLHIFANGLKIMAFGQIKSCNWKIFSPFWVLVHQQNSQAKLLTSFAETARPGKNLQHKPWPFSGFGICTCFFVWRVSVQKGPVRRWFTCIAKGFTVFSVLCSRQGIEALCNFVTRIVPTWSSLLSIGPAFCGTVPSF